MHYLDANYRTCTPGTIGVLETDREDVSNHVGGSYYSDALALGCVISARLVKGEPTRIRHEISSDPSRIASHIASRLNPRRPLWLVGFDIGASVRLAKLLEEYDEGEYSLYRKRSATPDLPLHAQASTATAGLWVDRDPPVILVLHHKSGAKLVVLDIRNWFVSVTDSELAEYGCDPVAAKDVGVLGKLAIGPCVRRAIGTYKYLLDLCRCVIEHDWGMLRWTAASQAMGLYRHRHIVPRCRRRRGGTIYQPAPKGDTPRYRIVCHDNPQIRQLEADAHYAGRTECFYVGDVPGPVYKLDVNSLYPSVMRDFEFPFKPFYWQIPVNGLGWCNETHGEDAIAVVEIDSYDTPFPVRTNQGLAWCTGRFVATLAGPELTTAVRHGCIVRWLAFARYKMAPLFEDYMEYLWLYRQSAKARGATAWADFAKSMQLGFYGKWAQRVSRYTPVADYTPPAPWQVWRGRHPQTGELCQLRAIGWDVEAEQDREYKESACVSIAAFVAAYARARMDTYREIAGARNCYYQCVDSLYVSQGGLDNLRRAGAVAPAELGRFRIDGEFPGATFRGYQNLDAGDHRIRGPLTQDAHWCGGRVYLEHRTERLSSAVTRPPDGTVRHYDVALDWNNQGPRGVVCADGWVRPWRLGDKHGNARQCGGVQG